jgi:hypothetical protein
LFAIQQQGFVRYQSLLQCDQRLQFWFHHTSQMYENNNKHQMHSIWIHQESKKLWSKQDCIPFEYLPYIFIGFILV